MYKISIQVFIGVDVHKKFHSVLIGSSRDIKLRTSSKLMFSISLTFKVLYLSSRLSEWDEIFCANRPRWKLVLIFYTSWSNLAPVVFESHYKMYESTFWAYESTFHDGICLTIMVLRKCNWLFLSRSVISGPWVTEGQVGCGLKWPEVLGNYDRIVLTNQLSWALIFYWCRLFHSS